MKAIIQRPDVVLIDGTNFFFKGSWGGNELTHGGRSVKELYSFTLSLCSLMKTVGEALYVICWDGGHRERTELSEAAVRTGLIPKAYKQERREARALTDDEKSRSDFLWQLEKARELVSCTVVRQNLMEGEEADDLVGGYCKRFVDEGKDVLIVTSDKDYYQLLWPGVRIYNSAKKAYLDSSYLRSEYGLDNADQWVDVGALAGETGPSSDTIYGCPGFGYKTAAKFVSQYGSLENLYSRAEGLFKDYLGKNGLESFSAAVKEGKYATKYKKEAMVLAYRPVVDLAWKLKKMHTDLNPPLPEADPDWRRLEKFLSGLDFHLGQNSQSLLLGI